MKTILRSQELSCPSCVAKIEKALKNVEGVQEAKVFFNTGRIEVEHAPEQASQETLVKAVRSAGCISRRSAPIWPKAPVLVAGETRRSRGGVLMNLSAFLTKTVI